eukprot:TRINITY_DN69821_c0_g1_i1.p1 TRINITY_DN69821_c0_g1~~TRINITY_DN69821_c0_g1_i1.p1  ORF type:complete len:293 (-),score=66.06 TRINITY_DN69821_c0_g1_i1:13-891(-)
MPRCRKSRAALAALAAYLSYPCDLMHFATPPVATASRKETASCRAAALGTKPKKSDLKALGRALPEYMVRAAAGDEEVALKRWADTLQWRCEIGDEELVKQPNPNLLRIQRYYPTFLHLPDKAGRPTYWEVLGNLDAKGLAREGLTYDKLRDNYIWMTLWTWDVAFEHDDRIQSTVIVDMKGFRFSSLTSTIISTFSQSSALIQKHFPERDHRLYVIHAPEWWRILYNMLSPFFSEKAKQKAKIITGERESLEILREILPEQHLPREYGGTGPPLGQAPLELQKRKAAQGGS